MSGRNGLPDAATSPSVDGVVTARSRAGAATAPGVDLPVWRCRRIAYGQKVFRMNWRVRDESWTAAISGFDLHRPEIVGRAVPLWTRPRMA